MNEELVVSADISREVQLLTKLQNSAIVRDYTSFLSSFLWSGLDGRHP